MSDPRIYEHQEFVLPGQLAEPYLAHMRRQCEVKLFELCDDGRVHAIQIKHRAEVDQVPGWDGWRESIRHTLRIEERIVETLDTKMWVAPRLEPFVPATTGGIIRVLLLDLKRWWLGWIRAGSY